MSHGILTETTAKIVPQALFRTGMRAFENPGLVHQMSRSLMVRSFLGNGTTADAVLRGLVLNWITSALGLSDLPGDIRTVIHDNR